MDKQETLEMIGLTQEQLTERVIAGLVDKLAERNVKDEDDRYTRTLREACQSRLSSLVDAAVAKIADERLQGMCDKLVSGKLLQPTNEWGDDRGKAFPLSEYITKQSHDYLFTKVNSRGESSGYQDKAKTRLEWLLDNSISATVKQIVEEKMGDAGNLLAQSVENSVRYALARYRAKQ